MKNRRNIRAVSMMQLAAPPFVFCLIAMVTVSHSFPCFLFGSDNSARVASKHRMGH